MQFYLLLVFVLIQGCFCLDDEYVESTLADIHSELQEQSTKLARMESQLERMADKLGQYDQLTYYQVDSVDKPRRNGEPGSGWSDCYQTACIAFNEATCSPGYTMISKWHCGGTEGYLTNKQQKMCCKP